MLRVVTDVIYLHAISDPMTRLGWGHRRPTEEGGTGNLPHRSALTDPSPAVDTR